MPSPQTLLTITSPHHTATSTSLIVGPTPACTGAAGGSTTTLYAKDAAGAVIAYATAGGSLAITSFAPSVDIYAVCGATRSLLALATAPFRTQVNGTTCTVGGTTYQPGALLFVNASSGANVQPTPANARRAARARD